MLTRACAVSGADEDGRKAVAVNVMSPGLMSIVLEVGVIRFDFLKSNPLALTVTVLFMAVPESRTSVVKPCAVCQLEVVLVGPLASVEDERVGRAQVDDGGLQGGAG